MSAIEAIPYSLPTPEVETPGDLARYYEVSFAYLQENLGTFLSSLTSQSSFDLPIRTITIPEEPDARVRRVVEIALNGSDRTDQDYPARSYRYASEAAGIPAIDIFNCLKTDSFRRYINKHKKLPWFRDPTNAILVFDPNRVRTTSRGKGGTQYTYTNPERKQQALLAIVGVNS